MDVVSAINYWYKKYLAEKEKVENLTLKIKEMDAFIELTIKK